MAKVKGPHHRGDYHVRSRRLVAAAYQHSDVRCWRCGLTHSEGVQRYGPRGAAWTAGHVVDGQVGGLLLPEHHHCNSSAGAVMGNKRRTPRTSRVW
jgi:hypothetical protein